MTEDEAKTKWCPFARTVEHEPSGIGGNSSPRNRVQVVKSGQPGSLYAERLAGVKCIASACMAWRVNSYGMGPTRVHPDVLDTGWKGWVVTDPAPDGRGYVGISPPTMGADGYCGLAGAPL